MAGDHSDAIGDEFSRQASSFEDPRYSFGDPRLLRWILANVPHAPDDAVLDVAAGTGHVARALAPRVRHVTAVDLTPAMLRVGQEAAGAAGIGNVVFQVGDAAALPFLDGSFDLVVSRFAVHHFEAPLAQLREMARVCRAAGRVAIVDLVTAEPDLADRYNELERLRDPTHVRALTRDELVGALQAAGLAVGSTVSHDQELDLERWLAQSEPPPDAARAIRDALEAELAGGAPTGMRPIGAAGALRFTQRWEIVVATLTA